MLSKRPHPMIGKLSELLVCGNRAGFSDTATSPRSPLEFKIQSPRGLKRYDLGGVGLGIVAALEKKSGDMGRHEILGKFAVCGFNSNRSDPIPCVKNCEKSRRGVDDLEMESLEDYTYVTCHGSNKSYTKVYYNGAECGRRSGQDRNGFDRGCNNSVAVNPSAATIAEDFSGYPTSDFLSSCHLCRKKLHGKDIYMYRGDKAFCSTECRSKQIMMDERKEQCRSEAKRSAKASSSPYATGQIFSTGILVI